MFLSFSEWNPTQISLNNCRLWVTCMTLLLAARFNSSVNGVGSHTSTHTCKYSMFTNTHTGICRWCLIAPLLHISDVSKFCTCSRDSHFCFAHHMIKEVIWYHLAVGNMNGDMPPTVLLSVSLCFGAKAYKRKSVQCILFCCLIKFKQPNVTLWVLRTVILGVCKPNSIMIMYMPVKEDKDDSEYTKMDI